MSQAPKPKSQTQKPISQAQIRKLVWQRACGRCEKCGSRHALQIDHCKPRAFGGESTLENQRLLCRSCNQRAAIETPGIHKMEKHLLRT